MVKSVSKEIWLLVAVYLAVCAYFLVLIINNYLAVGLNYDLDIFGHAFWSTLQGRFFYSSVEHGNHFRVHFSPFLFLLLPFFAIYQSSLTLLIIKVLFVCLGLFPVYFMSKKQTGSALYSFLLVFVFICYPPLHAVLLWGFHEVAFAIPLVLFIFLFRNSSAKLFYPFLFLALAVKENVALVMIFFSLYLIAKRQFVRGTIVALSSAGFYLLAIKVMMLLQGDFTFPHLYPDFGTTLSQVITTILTKPAYTFNYICQPVKIAYLANLYCPLLFAPLLNPWGTLLALPVLLQNLLSSNPAQQSILRQYPSLIIPCFMFGVIYLVRPALIGKKTGKVLYLILFLAMIAVSVFFLRQQMPAWRAQLKNDGSREKYAELLQVKEEVGRGDVIRTWNLGPYFIDRQESSHTYMNFIVPSTKYIVIDKGMESPERIEVIKKKTAGYFAVIRDGKHFLVLERQTEEHKAF